MLHLTNDVYNLYIIYYIFNNNSSVKNINNWAIYNKYIYIFYK